MARLVIFAVFLAVAIVIADASPAIPICGANEEYTTCGTSCPNTCQEPQPKICTLACIIGCQCKEGYIKNSEDKCVLVRDC